MQPKSIPLKERIIFALDVDSAEQGKKLVKRLESHIHFYKVGLQLFLAGWFPVMNRSDLKFRALAYAPRN